MKMPFIAKDRSYHSERTPPAPPQVARIFAFGSGIMDFVHL